MADENNNQYYNPPEDNAQQSNPPQNNQQQYYPPQQPQGEYNQYNTNNVPPQQPQGTYNQYNANNIPPQGYGPYGNMPPQEEKASVGLAILSYIIPIVGLILFITKKNDRPKTAKACGICALVSFIINIIVSIIISATSGALLKDIADDPSDFSSYSEDFNFDFDEDNAFTDHTEDKTTQPNTAAIKSMESVNWDDYAVCIGGKTIQLPCDWETFKNETGFDFDSSEYAAETLETNQYTTSVRVVKGEQKFYVRFINSDAETKTLDKCMVAGVGADDFYECDIVFAKGIKTGDTADKASITALFGEPSDVYDSEDSDFHIYTYEDSESVYNSFEITVSDGKISDIDLEYFDF